MNLQDIENQINKLKSVALGAIQQKVQQTVQPIQAVASLVKQANPYVQQIGNAVGDWQKEGWKTLPKRVAEIGQTSPKELAMTAGMSFGTGTLENVAPKAVQGVGKAIGGALHKAEDLVQEHPILNTKKEIPVKDVYGQKKVIPAGEAPKLKQPSGKSPFSTPREIKYDKIVNFRKQGNDYAKTAKEFGMSKERVRQIEAKVVEASGQTPDEFWKDARLANKVKGQDVLSAIKDKVSKADPLIQEAKKYKSAEELNKVLPTAEIKKGNVYPNDLTVDFPEGGTLHYQELLDKIIIRAVSNRGIKGIGDKTSSGVATKAIKSLMNYAKNTGKDIEVTGIYNNEYWKNLGFPSAKDSTSKLTKSQLTDIWNKANKQ